MTNDQAVRRTISPISLPVALMTKAVTKSLKEAAVTVPTKKVRL